MLVFLLFIMVEGGMEISLLMYIHTDAARRTQVHLTLSGEFSVESQCLNAFVNMKILFIRLEISRTHTSSLLIIY